MLIAQTPLRMSFLGGGTDFPSYFADPAGVRGGGLCLGAALDKYVYVVLKERFDDRIVLNYTSKEVVDSVDAIRHDLIREAMRLTGVEKGVEITTLADIPSEGSGLGSSSAITVCLLQALWQWQGVIRSGGDLAADACRIELDVLARPMGLQDAYFAALGGIRLLEFGPGPREVHTTPVAVRRDLLFQFNQNLLLYYTHRTRQSASILTAQQANIPDQRGTLDRLRAAAAKGLQILRTGDFDDFGRLLHEGWRLKTELAAGITDPAIDRLYRRALDAGALGGKILGAGGGGFLLLYCPLAAQDAVRRALAADLRELPFRLNPNGSRVMFNIRKQSYF